MTELIHSMQLNGGDKALTAHLTALSQDREFHYSFDLLEKISSENDPTTAQFLQNRIGILNNGLTGIAIRLLKEICTEKTKTGIH
ncbi:MAG: hypothetical protein LUF85_05305 [Bacteroides sp.]|nr:hypothetical protein [Bacteroides sp.]